MDEVDGMAGNEDRGGMQELINLIKLTKIPIICMCNDRNSQKVRSLANYCFDLRFQRPRVEQIKVRLCFNGSYSYVINISKDQTRRMVFGKTNCNKVLTLFVVWREASVVMTRVMDSDSSGKFRRLDSVRSALERNH